MAKYVFKKLQNKRVPEIIGWYLEVKSIDDLMAFHGETSSSLIQAAVVDQMGKNKHHHRNRLSAAIDSLAEVRGSNFLDSMSTLFQGAYMGQVKLLLQGYVLYFNPSCIGYCVDKDNEFYDVLDVRCSDSLVFPENEKINIIQFPGGTHYYVEIGHVQIKGKNGEEKWNSHSEALDAARDYLKSQVSRRL